MVMMALRVPVLLGLKKTLITVLLCGDTVNGAVGPINVKSAAFAPVNVTDEITRLPLPVLLMMTGFDPEDTLMLVTGKLRDVVLRLMLAPDD